MKKEFLLPGPNGYEISCLSWETGEPKAALLCLHGFAGDKYSSVIEALGKTLSSRGIRVLTLDWPGHGGSPVEGEALTVENCLRDLETVLAQLPRDLPRYLFATSFGGFLAVNYLVREPGAFDRVVLRSPALDMPHTFFNLLPEEGRAALARGEKINCGFDRPLWLDRRFAEDLQAHALPPADLSRIRGLVIQGDLDDVVCPADSRSFAERNGWLLHAIPGADHRYKNPGELAEILRTAEGFFCGEGESI